MLSLLLLIVAVVLFGIAGLKAHLQERFNFFMAGGLFTWELSTLFLSVRL